ncbi:hypothetical protein LEP1GSC179_0689 [Leptospira santarosai str. MOR084]|uniref:Uncharacterized protein n=1 Tax=Leptospira santarosai str. MOR084 TaxID=1049984 RepID=A0A0E2B9I7_9LEPT|nr:hypothetical protein LEP1GSC179_0689 [Leptospira santarosai str. MOR084]
MSGREVIGSFLKLSNIHSYKQYRLRCENLWKEYFGDQFEKIVL